MPFVVPLADVTFALAGEYDLQVEVDQSLAGDLGFHVLERD